MSKIPSGNVSLAYSLSENQNWIELETTFQISKYERSPSFWYSEVLANSAVTFIGVIQNYH